MEIICSVEHILHIAGIVHVKLTSGGEHADEALVGYDDVLDLPGLVSMQDWGVAWHLLWMA